MLATGTSGENQSEQRANSGEILYYIWRRSYTRAKLLCDELFRCMKRRFEFLIFIPLFLGGGQWALTDLLDLNSFFFLAIYTSNERIEDRPFFVVEQPYLGGESLPHFTHT